MKTINIVYTDGPARLETDGQGDLDRDIPRAIEEDYGFNLILQGVVEPADESSKLQYEALKADKEAKQKEAANG
jgi:hypothetical protein